MRARRLQMTGVVVAAAVAVLVAFAVSLSGDRSGSDAAQEDPTTTTTTIADPASGGVVATPDDSTLIATLAGDVRSYASPGGEERGTVPGTWHGRPSILPVIDQQPGWLHVRLAQRPNGSTAWIRRDDVDLATTPYRIEIDVATTRLRLYRSGEQVLDAPAGVGTEEAPTALGNHFVTFFQAPPDTVSGWGPFVIVTSSHSDTISDYQQSGDAIAAIHGPLGAEDEIGDTGAAVSHGCVRLHLDDLEVLRDVPAGSPIDIIDSSRESGSSA